MKCPNCGKWNQASLPHCIYCGQELPNDAYGPQGVPAWQLELEDRDRKNTYVRVDETGEQETTNDPRDTLASEMADLKSRKIMGEQKQRMLREEAARRGMAPSGRSVRTTSNRGTFFSAYDDPDTALRPVAPELVEEGEVAPDARRVVPVKYRTTYSSSQPEDEVYGYGNTRRIVNIQHPDESETVYDGYHDTSAYLPSFANQDEYENSMRLKNSAASLAATAEGASCAFWCCWACWAWRDGWLWPSSSLCSRRIRMWTSAPLWSFPPSATIWRRIP